MGLLNKHCTPNLLETFDFITKALADGYNVDEILLDFVKAFDSVLSIRLSLNLDYLGLEINYWRGAKDF